MSGIVFAWPWCFLALPLPWLLRRMLAPVPGEALRMPPLPAAAPHAPARAAGTLWLAVLGWLLLVTAAARPQMPGEMIDRHGGRSLMLAFDVSASMAVRDLQLDGRPLERLQAARQLAGDFLLRRERAGRDRVGLVVFGSQAYLHTPLTYDLAAVRDALGTAEVGLAGRETALGDAIALAVRHLNTAPETEPDSARALVLLSDGASTAGALAPLRAAWLAQREKVRVHAVGIGSAAELDEETLQGIAGQTGGTYLRATDGAALDAFFRQVDRIERAGPDGGPPLRHLHELYARPLGLAFALACWLLLRRPGKMREARA